jgi:hypothetical protein
MVEACRARMRALDITHETLDGLAGIQPGYSAKLLGPRPHRKIGLLTFPLLLGALGLALVAVEDAEQMARIRSRLVPRKYPKPEVPHWRNQRAASLPPGA